MQGRKKRKKKDSVKKVLGAIPERGILPETGRLSAATEKRDSPTKKN